MDNIIKELGFEKLEEYNNIYVNNNDIKYTDGDIEKTILNILKKKCGETDNVFPLLEEHIEDWATEYHLSWVRQNILKPIEFKKEDFVLELGGGTGIITEYVVKRVEKLITVEGTEIRAKSISTRCQRHDNLDIIVANFLNLDLLSIFGENSFNKILLIGVLEYVPKYDENIDSDPINKLLNVCKKLLKQDGELIIAIENKIGLKYLLGREEDHIGEKHYGTQSFYKKNDVTTFTKKNLVSRLNNAGFIEIDSYYPFPDYKLPKVIIKEDLNLYNQESKKLISSVLSGIKTRNYSGRFADNLEEDRILNNVIEEEIIGSVSNSFLLVANKKHKVKKERTPFLYYFSTSRRYQYSNEMSFKNSNEGIIVSKKWNGENTEGNLLNLNVNNENQYALNEGEVLGNLLNNCFFLNEKEDYLKLLNRWVDFLIKNIDDFERNFDLLPINVIIDKSNKLMFFDYDEWQSPKKLSTSEIIARYVLTNKNHVEWLFGKGNNLKEYVELILGEREIKINNLRKIEEIHNYINNNILKKDYLSQREEDIDNSLKKKNIWKKWIIIFFPPIIFILKKKITKKFYKNKF